MRELTPTLHTGQLNGVNLRFFRSPLSEPDFPWHSVDDLHAALQFPRDLRRHFKVRLQETWAANVRTIATSSGVTTIAPHTMAQGLLGAAEEVGCAPYTAEADYAAAVADAFNLTTEHMAPTDSVAYALAAFRHGGGM